MKEIQEQYLDEIKGIKDDLQILMDHFTNEENNISGVTYGLLNEAKSIKELLKSVKYFLGYTK